MPIQNKIDQIKERSEYTVEMLGKTPPFLVRVGMSIFFIFIAVILGLCFLIRYPDIVVGRIVLTNQNPTVRIVWPSPGKIEKIYVQNKDFVKKDSVLMLLQSTSDIKDIQYLKTFIEHLQSSDIKGDLMIFEGNLRLGSLQNMYADLLENLKVYLALINDNDVEQQKRSLILQIQQIQSLNNSIKKQGDILGQQTKLSQANYRRNVHLFEQGVISTVELEAFESSYLQYQRDLESVSTQIINNDIRVNQINSQLIDLTHQQEETVRNKFISIKEKLQVIRAAIEEWEKAYLIRSPIDGWVSFHGIWSSNQYVAANQEIFDVIPENTVKAFGKILLSEQNSGKLKIGQRVIIKLDGYNYREFGVINSHIQSISLTPINGNYTAYVELPDVIKTTHNKIIAEPKEIQGIAEIVTEDLRLIDRIFYTIRALFAH